jgi:hypothetical protein
MDAWLSHHICLRSTHPNGNYAAAVDIDRLKYLQITFSNLIGQILGQFGIQSTRLKSRWDAVKFIHTFHAFMHFQNLTIQTREVTIVTLAIKSDVM